MKILLTRRVSGLTWNADDWELFSNMPGANGVATKLNHKFTTLVNSGANRHAVYDDMEALMHKYSNFGAADTEPLNHLIDLLDKTFGENME